MATKRALIVDDSTTAQYRLKKMLRAYPLDIDIVDSGEAALRYLAHHSPDVIFMDHLMPGMDGFRALQIIKSHPETAMIPVIMYTSKSGDVYTGQARALGALDVLSKDRINATDLARVMETIHIYPLPKSQAHSNTDVESPEDNRRFITSRVSRELQTLRQALRQEFSNITQQQIPPAAPDTTAPASNSRWGIGLILIAGIIASLYFLLQIKTQLEQNAQQQYLLAEQLQELIQQPLAQQTPAQPANISAETTAANNTPTLPVSGTTNASINYLDDLAWTFNQQGALSFQQHTIDTSTVLRLHELLHRLASRGFNGTAAITIYVGDFCSTKDNNGIDQLAPESSNLSNCMLSSELYGMERLLGDYQRETEMILRNLTGSINSTIKTDIHALPGMHPYPERLPTFFAGEWNSVAQKNNRIELVLVENN